VVVSAAASLTNAFKDAAQGYEAQYPGSKVSLNFAASGVLLQQIVKARPWTCLPSADQETMDAAQKQGLVLPADRQDFVGNSLVLIVPHDSKLGIKSLSDLTHKGVTRVAIANPASVPVGRYSEGALKKAKLWDAVQPKAIGTQNVRQSLDYVARGEVDAGFVYATDAAIMKDKVKRGAGRAAGCPRAVPDRHHQGQRQRGRSEALRQLSADGAGASHSRQVRLQETLI